MTSDVWILDMFGDGACYEKKLEIFLLMINNHVQQLQL